MINYVYVVGYGGAKMEIKHYISGKKMAWFLIAVNQPAIGKWHQKPFWVEREDWAMLVTES